VFFLSSQYLFNLSDNRSFITIAKIPSNLCIENAYAYNILYRCFYSAVEKMTSPTFGLQDVANSRMSNTLSSPASATISPHTTVGLLRRSNSNSSLNSVLSLVDTKTGEQHFRLCIHCRQVLLSS